MDNIVKHDVVVIGGGPAGMAAALSVWDNGVTDVVIIDRETSVGGILKQCVHSGFGLHKLGRELTGPEYAAEYAKRVFERNIKVYSDTMVIDINKEKLVIATNRQGILKIQAKAVILAMGCRERPRGALNIAGTRASGVMSAGTAQKYVNIDGYMPGKKVVILGSGDIGLIMARRMTLEGARVMAVCELMPYSGGLARNIEQCLNDFNIPLRLSHTVVEIHGKERVEGVTIARVDENRRPIKESEEYIPCDTLLLSCGLIPENELTKGAGIALDRVTGGAVVDGERETEIPGVFACGNVLHVHDLVDYVSEESVIAGQAAAKYIRGEGEKALVAKISVDGKVRYTVPQRITEAADTEVYFRVANVYRDAKIIVKDGERVILSKKAQKLAPAEMEKVKLTREMLSSLSGNEISFSIEV